ncbi:MAG: hypothetical protein ACE5HK_07230 [Candidatus Methylomirabilales bacterium]
MPDTVLFVLLLCFTFILGLGLGMAVAEMRRGRISSTPPSGRDAARAGLGTPEPADDELLLFDRVTAGLSALPLVEDPARYPEAEERVMAEVAARYGLTPAEVQQIYRRVRAFKFPDLTEGS